MVYSTPIIEIEKLEASDVILVSGDVAPGTGNDYETDIMSLRKGGTIAGGSTVSNVANNSGASNAFSAGDIFGLR